MALVGNKADLHEKREVAAQVSISHPLTTVIQSQNNCLFVSFMTFFFLLLKDGMDYAEKNGMFFIETSAKTADNINQLFEVKKKNLTILNLKFPEFPIHVA